MLLDLHLGGKQQAKEMDKMSGWQGGERLSFFPISKEHRRLILYAQNFQNGSSISVTKRSRSNHEFRCTTYYDVNACEGHLVQF